MRYIKGIVVSMLLLLMLVGCSKNTKVDPTNTPKQNQTETPVVETKEPVTDAPVVTPETVEGKVKSVLTGEWVDEEVGSRRPYAVMINNIEYANPQCGIGQASILYECLVEGGITRLMAIFEDFDAERIGSVRSARHYFVSIADEYDAIFAHYGQTVYATDKIKELGVDNLSGLEGVGATVFYRDTDLKAPHNAFASYKGLIQGTEQKKYRTQYRDNLNVHYNFNNEDVTPSSEQNVNKVTLGFSTKKQPYFTYNKETKLYERYQYGGKHIDATTKQQLTFKNILIQYVKESNIDENGYQTMEIENASGKGVYITNGKAVDITWKKNEDKKTMSYFDKNGEKLSVNTGKTYITLFPDNRIDSVVME